MIESAERTCPNNTIISRTPPDEYRLLMPCLQSVQLVAGQRLIEAGEHIACFIFPLSAVAAQLDQRTGIMTAILGRSDAIGAVAALAPDAPAPSCTVVLVPGQGYRLLLSDWIARRAELPGLDALLKQSATVQWAQTAQRVTCAVRHSLVDQVADLLLTLGDQAITGTIPITQDTISRLLGVGRTSVNTALPYLDDLGIIRTRRGHIYVQDRRALAHHGCGCRDKVRFYAEAVAQH